MDVLLDSVQARIFAKSRDEVLAELNSPSWSHYDKGAYATAFHWQACVPGELRDVWDSLSLEAKLVACIMADNESDRNNQYLD